MAIPKKIHYCWFGKNSMPDLALKCIESWKKFCPDYEIIEWNEDNFDYRKNRYAREAYEMGKWAFVTDYARLDVIYEYGGVYLDTDVELLKPIDDLLTYEGFMGFQAGGRIATGLGFGAQAHHPVIKELLKDYEGIPFFLEDGSYDKMACPERNHETLNRLGLVDNNEKQMVNGICMFPSEFFSPIDYHTGKKRITPNTYSVHYYAASWLDDEDRRSLKLRRILGERLHYWLYRLMGWV